jgi:hypothetical protein
MADRPRRPLRLWGAAVTPSRAMLEAAAEVAHLPHDRLTDAALLALLVESGDYPTLYRLPDDADLPPRPLDGTVLVSCEECEIRGLSRVTDHRVPVDPAWAEGASCSALVRCPQCDSLLSVPLLPPATSSALAWWRWRWVDEARRAHRLWRGLGGTPRGWWQEEWGYPVPVSEPSDPAPLPSRIVEPSMPAPLSQPCSYHLHALGLSLLGYLTEASPAGDPARVRREVSVDLPQDPALRLSVLQEMMRLSGRDPATASTRLHLTSARVWAVEGMGSGQWWPRAELPEAEPSPALLEPDVLDLCPVTPEEEE